MAISSAKAVPRATIASIKREIRNGNRPADDPQLIEARRELAYVRLLEEVEEVIRDWPALTDEQCRSIVALLNAGGGVNGAA